MFSLRDFPLWLYKIFTLKDLQTIYPSNSYNLFRKLLSLSEQATFSNRAGYFLFSSRLYSLSNIPNPSRKDSRTSKVHNLSTNKVHNLSTSKAHNLSTSKAHNLSTSKVHNLSTSKAHSLQQAKPTTILQAKVHNLSTSKVHSHTTSLMLKKHSENKQIQQNIPNIPPFNIFLK